MEASAATKDDDATAPTHRHLARRLGAEAVGTGYLLVAVVGSGIFGQRLASENAAMVLLVTRRQWRRCSG